MSRVLKSWKYEGVLFEAVLAETRQEFTDWYNLRFRVFCLTTKPKEISRYPPENFPDQLEHGKEDEYSSGILLYATENGVRKLVGGLRLIPCEKGYFIEGDSFNGQIITLPESHRGFPVRANKTFEASRLTGYLYQLPSKTNYAVISTMLNEAGILYTLEVGREYWVCVINHHVAERGRSEGWLFDPLIEGVSKFHNTWSEACIIPLKLMSLKTVPVYSVDDLREMGIVV